MINLFIKLLNTNTIHQLELVQPRRAVFNVFNYYIHTYIQAKHFPKKKKLTQIKNLKSLFSFLGFVSHFLQTNKEWVEFEVCTQHNKYNLLPGPGCINLIWQDSRTRQAGSVQFQKCAWKPETRGRGVQFHQRDTTWSIGVQPH